MPLGAAKKKKTVRGKGIPHTGNDLNNDLNDFNDLPHTGNDLNIKSQESLCFLLQPTKS